MSFGDWLDAQRSLPKLWSGLFFAALAALLAWNVFERPHEAEFVLDAYPGFWAVFGFFVCSGMVIFVKKILQTMIVGPEDTYDE